jgi:hypothetical protein
VKLKINYSKLFQSIRFITFVSDIANTSYLFILHVAIFVGFHINVLTKLDIVIENQQEMLNLLKHVVSASSVGSSSVELFEDIFPQRISSPEEFQQLNEQLGNVEFRKKMVKVLILYIIILVLLN